jgi:hypothetical protein
MFLRNLKIGTRLALAFGVILIMVLGIIVLGVSRLQSQDQLLSDFATQDVPGVATSLKWANSSFAGWWIAAMAAASSW